MQSCVGYLDWIDRLCYRIYIIKDIYVKSGGRAMANAGDGFEVVLSQSHVAWGTCRFTNSREPINGEGYIPIPLNDARRL